MVDILYRLKNEYRILKLAETTTRKGIREDAENRDEPIGFIIHLYMEISQGKSCCGYLCLKQAKMSFSLFSILLKIQRTGEGNWSCQVQRGLVLVGGGGGEESWEEG
jgi:hypothetical protein